MTHEAPFQPVGMPETDPAAIDPAVQAAIEADSELRLAEHEHELAQIREDEGRKAIEDGLHNIAYTAEAHRLAHNPSELTGEHGLSGYDEMERRAREAGRQAVESHRTRVAEIRAEADAEYERVRDFERAYEADKWDDVVIALDKMAAYAEKTDDWTEFDTHHEQLRNVEKAAYLRHFDAQHPEGAEPDPAPVAPEGGEDPDPAAPQAPEAAAADPGDDWMEIADLVREGDAPAPVTRPVPGRTGDDSGEAPAPRPAAPFGEGTADDDSEGRPTPPRRALPTWAAPEGDEGYRPYPSPFGEDPRRERRLPSWDDAPDPVVAPRRREGGLDEDAPLPLSPLEDTSRVGIPEQLPYRAPEAEQRDPSLADRWGGTTDAAGRVPGWTPKWFKQWRANVAQKKRLEEEERVDGAAHVQEMDDLDQEEAAFDDERRRVSAEVDERDIVVRGAGRRVDPRAHRDRGALDEMLRNLDE